MASGRIITQATKVGTCVCVCVCVCELVDIVHGISVIQAVGSEEVDH